MTKLYYKAGRGKAMKLHINIDKSITESEILITTDQMTEEVNRIVDFINRTQESGAMLSGIRNGRVELLDQEKLIRIYAENGKVYARTDRDSYQLKLRLYELEERLDSSLFVRISNSEIVNLKKVKSLDLSFTGTICMELTNGEVSYVSRRYVARIKKLLGL